MGVPGKGGGGFGPGVESDDDGDDEVKSQHRRVIRREIMTSAALMELI